MKHDFSEWLDQEKSSAVDLLAKLVNTNSFTQNISGVNRVQDVLEQEFLSLGLKVERIKKEDCGDQLVVRSQASGDQDVLLMGHVDTVHPPESSFSSFSLDGEKAFGPGVLDMKGGLVVILWALKAVYSCGALEQIPLTLIVNTDEETGSNHSRSLISEHCVRARNALVFEWGRKENGLITKRNGVKWFNITVKGKSAHAGNTHRQGKNAVSALARLIPRLESLTDYEKGITVNVGTVSGGTSPNVIPDTAQASFDLRAPTQKTFDQLDTELQDLESSCSTDGISVAFRQTIYVPPFEQTPESLALYESFKPHAEGIGLTVSLIPEPLGGGSNANDIGYCGVPCLDGLGPYGEFPHSEQEFIEISSLWPKILSVASWLLAQGTAEK